MSITNKIKDSIAANIAFYRKQKGFTQKELAQLLGVKTTTVSTWERASSLPDAETLFKLCEIFHVSLTDMYGCDSIDMKETFAISDFEIDIIKKYRLSDNITKELVHRALSLEIPASKGKKNKIS